MKVHHPSRILIVRVGAMGDVLHGLPAVAGLRKLLPETHIAWVVEPRWAPLLVRVDGSGPLVDRVHLAPTRAWKERPFAVETASEIHRLRRELRAQHYDLCVDLQGSVRSAVIGWMAGAARFVGPAEPRERVARRLYAEHVRTHDRHVIGQACELLSQGIGLPVLPAPVELPVDTEAEGWCTGMLARLGVGAHPFALLAAEAGWGAKAWPAEHYAALASRLAGAGLKVLVNAVPQGSGDAAQRIAAAGPALIVRASVAQLVALTRRAALVIGGDTGPVHLAAALGRPVVALFGPTDPLRNGPSFPGSEERVQVLRDPESQTDHKRHKRTEAGLARIQVEQVVAAAYSLKEPELG